MSWRTTAVLFLILVIVGGYVYYDSQQLAEATPTPLPTVAADLADEQVQILTDLTLNDVKELVVVRTTDETTAAFSFDGLADWQQTAPQATAVLSTTMTSYATGLLTLTSTRVFSSAQNPLSAYGLDQPAHEIHLEPRSTAVDTQRRTIYVGNETPTKDGYYIQTSGDSNVYVVPKGAIDNIVRLLDEPPVP